MTRTFILCNPPKMAIVQSPANWRTEQSWLLSKLPVRNRNQQLLCSDQFSGIVRSPGCSLNPSPARRIQNRPQKKKGDKSAKAGGKPEN